TVPIGMAAAQIDASHLQPEQFQRQRKQAGLSFDAGDGCCCTALRTRIHLRRVVELKSALSEAIHQEADRIADSVDAIFKSHGLQSPPHREELASDVSSPARPLRSGLRLGI